MKFEISKYSNEVKYCIMLEYFVFDYEIAEFLNLTLKEYRDILFENGANVYKINEIELYFGGPESYFRTIKDAQKAIDKLEGYLIMKTLTEDI